MMQFIFVAFLAIFKQLDAIAIVIQPNTNLAGTGITVELPNTENHVNAANQWVAVRGHSAVDAWGVELTLDEATYGFSAGQVSTIQVEMDMSCSGECDVFYAFAAGNRYITFAHDGDNGFRAAQGGPIGGLFTYPACGASSFLVGDPSGLLDDRNDWDEPVWAIREGREAYGASPGHTGVLTGGGTDTMDRMSSAVNGRNFPVTFTFTNDPVANTFTVKFESTSGNYNSGGSTCVFNEAFPTCEDFVFLQSPDPSDGADHLISSYTVIATDTGNCNCASKGDGLGINGHECQCQAECGDASTDRFCKPLGFVTDVLGGVNEGDAVLCPSGGTCCCSCPPCAGFITRS